MSLTIYGIKNCDTMKKARAWLDTAGKAYAFHDYKAVGIDRARLEGWAWSASSQNSMSLNYDLVS
jgi:arsenate reductase